MDRLKTVATLLLLAFWLPGSSHTLLQSVGFIHHHHADHDADPAESPEHNDDNHDIADGHCLSSSPEVSVIVPIALATPTPIWPHCTEWISEFHVDREPSGLAPPGRAPPPLLNYWQFSFRAALPPRAPSPLS